MRKVIVALLAATALAFVSYGSYAHCGKCGHDGSPKCSTQSAMPGCKAMSEKPCSCCEKCAKGECKAMSGGEPCCDKCAKGGCCKMSGDKPACNMMSGKACCGKCDCCGGADGKHCCDKCAKGECKAMSGGEPCCDKCTCAAAKKSCAPKAETGSPDFAPDPVCGMDVETKDAKSTYEYEGKTYYFCCESCKERFSKEPSKFLGK